MKIKKKVMSAILCLVMIVGSITIMPTTTVHAYWCPECEDIKDSDEVCSECYVCHDCRNYCLFCGRCEDCVEMCDRCDELCLECHEELGGVGEYSPCDDCGRCKEGVDYCLNCGRCEDCVEMCDRCGEVCLECHADIDGVDEYGACPQCGKCKVGVSYCSECGVCDECEEICDNCSMCLDCAQSEGLHCPECENCYDDVEQCPLGEEHCADHCLLCENCGECFYGSESDYCENCQLCNDCAVDEGLHCADCGVCCNDEDKFCEDCGLCEECAINDGLHCPECGNCYESVEQCEAGGDHCVDCCERCQVCDKCFEEVYQCAECAKKGVNKCINCCEHSKIYNCDEHSFNASGVCTKCGYKKTAPTAKPSIILQPKDSYVGKVPNANDPNVDWDSNCTTIRVAVDNQTDVTYEWQYSFYGSAWKKIAEDTSLYSSGLGTSKITLFIPTDCCYESYKFRCVITNKFGSVTSDEAKIYADHNYIAEYEPDSHAYWGNYPDDESKHALQCCGEGCDSYLLSSVEDHTYGDWVVTKEATATSTGLKTRTCTWCYEKDTRVIPKLHEHTKSTKLTYGTVSVNGETIKVHGYACTICGEFVDYEEHTLKTYTQSAATETTEGKGYYACTTCSYKEYFQIAKLAHTHDYLKDGYSEFVVKDYCKYQTYDEIYHWSICVDKLADGSICGFVHDKEAHHFSAWETDSKDSTVACKTCEDCDFKRVMHIPEKYLSNSDYFVIDVKDAKIYVNGKEQEMDGRAYVLPGDKVKVVSKITTKGKIFSDWYVGTINYIDETGESKWNTMGNLGIISSDQLTSSTMEFVFPTDMKIVSKNVYIYPYTKNCTHLKSVGYKLESSAYEATCECNGKEADEVCLTCGYVKSVGAIIESTGHDYQIDEATVVKATCHSKGYTGDVVCSKCGVRYTGLKASSILSEAGQTTGVDKSAHKYDAGVVTTKPTCQRTGVKEYTCSVCGGVKTEILPKDKDTHVYGTDWKSDENSHWQVCKCGNKTEAQAHTFKWVVDKAPTTSAAGEKHQECSVCGYKLSTVTLNKLKVQKITTAKIKNVKTKVLKKKAVKIRLKAKASGKGKLTYKVIKYPKRMKKYISVSKKGIVTLRKKAKKGIYKIRITAAANGDYVRTVKVIRIRVR